MISEATLGLYVLLIAFLLMLTIFFCCRKAKQKTQEVSETEVANRAQLQQHQHNISSRQSFPDLPPEFSTIDFNQDQFSESNWQLRRDPSLSGHFSNAPYPRQEYDNYINYAYQESIATQTPQMDTSNRPWNRGHSYNGQYPRPTVYPIPNFARPNIRSFPNYDARRAPSNVEPPPSWTNVYLSSSANISRTNDNRAKSVLENEEPPPPSYFEAISSTPPNRF